MSDPADNGWAPPDSGPSHGDPDADPYGAHRQPQPYGHAYRQPPVKRPWDVPLRAGAEYHHMARTDAHRWWRPLVGSLAILAGGLGSVMVLGLIAMVVFALVTGGMPGDPAGESAILGNEIADLGLNLASLALFLPFALLVPWLVQRRRPGTVSSVAGRLRGRWLLICAGVSILFCAVAFGTSWLASLTVDDPAAAEEWPGWGRFVLAAAVIIALVPFQASAEEYVFRGWLLQGIGACTLENARGRVGQAFSAVFRTPWPGIAVGSALFMAGHGYTGWGMLDIFMFGAIAGWLTVRTGGLEAAIALHVFNNLMAFLISASAGRLDIEQGDVPWQYVVADVAPMLLYAAVVSWLVRRLRIQTVVAGPSVALSADSSVALSADPSTDPSAAAIPVDPLDAVDAVDTPPGPPLSQGQEAAER